jgi:hypothetical protein
MAFGTREGHEHEVKWNTINRRLNSLGFWVMWEFSHLQMEHRYAIGRDNERKPMGIYNDEDTAMAMVKMILSNAKHEGELK